MRSKICVIDSIYTFLLYLIINKCNVEGTFFIFWKNMPDNICKQFLDSYKTDIPFLAISSPRNFLRNFIYWINFKKILLKYNLKGLPVYGQDHLPISRMFLNYTNCEFYEYEDGLASYKVQPNVVRNKLIRKLMFSDVELRFGRSSKVKKIYLTNPAMLVPKDIINKVEWVNIKAEWEVLSFEQKDFLIKLYGIDKCDISSITTLIITRPLSEEGFMTEEEKIKLVKRIICKWKDSVAIKPHYVEKTNYELIFTGVRVIKEIFPLELLLLVYGSVIKNIVTIGHCSIENFIPIYYPEINYISYDI